ncbi:hypothetical protein AZE42_13428 [Rhizopogon vesiculosus]|uniref:Uncharacterized protein n=1 Tax=Rhizopogon vesiculosus TaxID=180088 RepID=A0A1J8QUS1_9AGAM|nr:hypothetical protein AZE42_13428 [Rhizopogon vesiculosus]
MPSLVVLNIIHGSRTFMSWGL